MRRVIAVFTIFISLGLVLFISYGGCDGGGGGGNINETGVGTEAILEPDVLSVTFEGEDSDIAFIILSFLSEELIGLTVNAGIDLNGDGSIAAYQTGQSVQEEWIVQNELLPIANTEYSFDFILSDTSIINGDIVDVVVIAGDDDVAEPWDGTVPPGTMNFEGPVVVMGLDLENVAEPQVGFTGFGGFITKANAQSSSQLGTPGDRDGKDPKGRDVFLRDGLPDVKQGPNECVGFSIANSLSWLARKCGFEDKFVFSLKPDENSPPEEVMLDMGDSRDVGSLGKLIISEVYGKIPGATIGEIGTKSFGGVVNAKIKEGKDQLAKDLGLPITTQVLSREKGEFKFDDITKFMRDGCDVELILSMLDIDTGSNLMKGHAVTLKGFVDGADKKGLVINDPGINTKSQYKNINISDMGGITYTYVFEKKKRTALVDLIVVECCLPIATPAPVTALPTSPPMDSVLPPSIDIPQIPGTTPEPTPGPTPVPTPAPSPEPVKAPGVYEGTSGACGIDDLVLSVSSEGNLLIMNFGDNGGTVTFAKTEDPDVFTTIRDPLFIMGIPGFVCTITCAPGLDLVFLDCVGPDNITCSDDFELVE